MSINKVLMQQKQSDGSYNSIYPQVDAYTKSETLTSDTSQMFGLSNGTPEQVMQYLGKYAQYWWKVQILGHYEQVRTPGSGYWYGISRNNNTFYYSDETGNNRTEASLISPKTSIFYGYEFDSTKHPELLGHYIRVLSSSVVWVPSTTSFYNGANPSGSSPNTYLYINSFETITYKYIETQFVGYVQSNNRNAYPDSGEQDGYNYTYLGVPLSNAALLTISDKL